MEKMTTKTPANVMFTGVLYLSTFLAREDALASILLYEAEHEPIANQRVIDDLNELDSRISQLKEMNTDTAAETAERLEKEKTIMQQRIWNVTKERIEDYQRLTGYFFPRSFNPVYMSDTSENSSYHQILNNFVQGGGERRRRVSFGVAENRKYDDCRGPVTEM